MSGGKSERDRPGFAQDDDPDAFGALIVQLLAGGTIYQGETPNQSAGVWFVPLWPEIMQRIELGDRLIEVS